MWVQKADAHVGFIGVQGVSSEDTRPIGSERATAADTVLVIVFLSAVGNIETFEDMY